MSYDPPGDRPRDPADQDLTPLDAATEATGPEPDEALAPRPQDTPDEADTWPVHGAGEPPEEMLLAPLPRRPRNGGSPVLSVLLVILSLGLVACALWAVKLHRDKVMVEASFDQALAMVAEVAPPQLGERLAAVRGDLQAGKLVQVGEKLGLLRKLVRDAINAPEGGEGPTGPLPEEAYKDLPPDAAKFFRAHEDLFRRFLALCDRSRQLRDAGQDVNALRKARDEIIESARLGQEQPVRKGMMRMARMLGGDLEGGQAGKRAKLQAKIATFKRAVNEAVKGKRDPRAALALVRQSQEAAQQGDLDKAGQLLDKAISVARHAPRARAQARRPGGWLAPGRAQRANPLADLMRTVMRLMLLEEKDLGAVWNQLNRLQGRLKNPEAGPPSTAILPVIDSAMKQLKGVAERRQALTLRLNQRGKAPRGQRAAPPLGEFTQGRDNGRRALLVVLGNRLDSFLDRVRDLPAEEYQASKPALVKEAVRALTQPPTAAERTAMEMAEPPAKDRVQATRVRAKFLKASPALQQMELAGKDTKAIDDLLAQARQKVTGRDYTGAESLLDQALGLLGIPLEQFNTPASEGELNGNGAAPGGASLLDSDEDVKLNLSPRRGRLRSRPAGGAAPAAPVAPPPAETPAAPGE